MYETVQYFYIGDGRFPDYLILLNLEYSQEDDKWVGVCAELGTSTFADTLEELRHELREAVQLQLNEVNRLGFVQEFLRDHRVPQIVIRPTDSSQDSGFVLAANAD
jgi:predicted RNase H-like HicB family nuclease